MLSFGKGKLTFDISYSTLISAGVIGVGLWFVFRDETKPSNGLLGFLKKGGPQTQTGAKVHQNSQGQPNVHSRMKRPSPPPPVPRQATVDMEGTGNDGIGQQSQRGNPPRRW